MYFININKLKQDIIEDRFSQRDRFLYLFACVILTEIFLIMPDFFPELYRDITWGDKVVDIFYIIIVAIGTFVMYKFNGGEKGKDFTDRYLAIIWVVGIRAILWFILIGVVLEIIALSLNWSDELVDYGFLFLEIGMEVYIYYRSSKVIKEIALATR